MAAGICGLYIHGLYLRGLPVLESYNPSAIKKHIFAPGLSVLAVTAGFSQSFMHGAGLNIFVATAPGGKAAVNGGFSYSPRFNFIEQDNMSV